MNKLRNIFNKLKLAVNSPRIYLVNHFEDLRNEIDIESQTFLNKDGLSVEGREKVIQQQEEMIKEVDLIQSQCLTNLDKIKCDPISLGDFEQRLNSLDLEDQNAVLNVEKNLFCALYLREKFLFVNQGIIFLNKKKDKEVEFIKVSILHILERTLDSFFGVLLIVEDEYLRYSDDIRQKIENDKVEKDWCNEFLRFYLMCSCLQDVEAITAVHRIQLSLGQQEELKLKYLELDKLILKDWLDELPALKDIDLYDCSLTDFDPVTFSSVNNLQVLNLSLNQISVLPDNAFQGLYKLTYLKFYINQISDITEGAFSSLNNLRDLDLSNNQISVISERLFQGLNKLKQFSLDSNQITTLPAGAFQSLHNLTHLQLRFNLISVLSEGAFQGLSDLKDLFLGNNQISVFPEQAFQSLHNLTCLSLNNNQIAFIPEGAFQGLHSLTHLNISANEISELPVGLFRGLSNLSNLYLRDNRIGGIPGGMVKDLVGIHLLDIGFSFGNKMFRNLKGLDDLSARLARLGGLK